MMHKTAFDDGAVQRAARHSDPLRSTALLMHTMTADDRSWVMAQLKPGQREDLAPLLAELDALGFSTDSFEVDWPPALPPKPLVHPSQNADAQLIAALNAVPLHRMQAALRSEPPVLIRRIAAIHRWSWWAAVAGVVGESTGNPVLAVPSAAKPNLSALDRAVLDALRLRVKTLCLAAEAQDDRSPRWRSIASLPRQSLGQLLQFLARGSSPNPN